MLPVESPSPSIRWSYLPNALIRRGVLVPLMLGSRWSPPPVERYLRRRGVVPHVRSSRNQAEVDFLPPYGDPEVNMLGEVATYLVVGAAAVEGLDRLRD